MESTTKPTTSKPIQKAVGVFENLSFDDQLIAYEEIKEIYSAQVIREKNNLLGRADKLGAILENLKS